MNEFRYFSNIYAFYLLAVSPLSSFDLRSVHSTRGQAHSGHDGEIQLNVCISACSLYMKRTICNQKVRDRCDAAKNTHPPNKHNIQPTSQYHGATEGQTTPVHRIWHTRIACMYISNMTIHTAKKMKQC